MNITLRPIDDSNREAVLALTVREDQPFVAPNDVSLRQAAETEAEAPGVARPFAIYADEELVGFCMFAFNPEDEDEEDRYYLWRFMIDQRFQGKGYGQAALDAIIRYFKDNGADLVFTTTPQLLDATLKAAVKHPKVGFYNCSACQPFSSVKSYYCRIYEGKFITGLIAGALADNDLVGYVGSYPIMGVPASINAL